MKGKNVAFLLSTEFIRGKISLYSNLSCRAHMWRGLVDSGSRKKQNQTFLDYKWTVQIVPKIVKMTLEIFRDSTNNEGGAKQRAFRQKMKVFIFFCHTVRWICSSKASARLNSYKNKRNVILTNISAKVCTNAMEKRATTRKNFVVFARLITWRKCYNLYWIWGRMKKVSVKRNSNRKIDENSNLSDL